MTLAELRASSPVVTPPRGVLGREEPRLFTRPLRPLTRENTLGHQAIDFAAQVLGVTLLPWQRWWLLHALELNPDGTFRYRTILTLVARQNGKTWLIKVLALWSMFMGHSRLVLGAAQSLDIARESWQGAVDMTGESPELLAEVMNVRHANGEQCITLVQRDAQGKVVRGKAGARYRIAAATRSAGRGLSVDLLILDEIREHRTAEAWAALSKTTMARPNALTVCISNAGDDQSVVLNQLRAAALGELDPSLALFEWSAPDGCAMDDPQAWAYACPALNHPDAVSEAAIRVSLATDPPAVFRTEVLCQHVPSLDGAIDPGAWRACADPVGTASLADGRHDRVALCVDVSPDNQHVTLMGAALLPDGRVRLFSAGAWSALDSALAAIGPIVEAIKPQEFGWFPNGPAAAMAPELRTLRLKFRRTIVKIYQPKDGVRQVIDTDEEELVRLGAGLEKEACQTFAAAVSGGRVLHPDDPLLNAHVHAAVKLPTGDGWRFGRNDSGQVDAAYAAAGALYLVRMVPEPEPVPRSAVY